MIEARQGHDWSGATPSVDADAYTGTEHRAAPSEEDAGQKPREERGDLPALEAADLPAHLMPPTVFTDSKVAYTRRLPLANVVVRQLCTVVPSISAPLVADRFAAPSAGDMRAARRPAP